MYDLAGEYICKIDAKGRVRLPSGLIKQICTEGAQDFTVNRGFDKHLMLYSSDVWAKKTKEINQLNIYKKKERQAIRYFYRGATKVSLDTADRLLLPKALIDYAGISKELVLFAYQEQVEIWSRDEYYAKLEEEPDDFGDLMDSIYSDRNNGTNISDDD